MCFAWAPAIPASRHGTSWTHNSRNRKSHAWNKQKNLVGNFCLCCFCIFAILGFGRKSNTLGKGYVFPCTTMLPPSFTHPLTHFRKGKLKNIIFICCFPLCVYAFYTRPGHGSPRHSTGTEEMTPREAGFHVFPRRVSCFPFYAFLALFYRDEIQEIIPIKHHPCCQLHWAEGFPSAAAGACSNVVCYVMGATAQGSLRPSLPTTTYTIICWFAILGLGGNQIHWEKSMLSHVQQCFPPLLPTP